RRRWWEALPSAATDEARAACSRAAWFMSAKVPFEALASAAMDEVPSPAPFSLPQLQVPAVLPLLPAVLPSPPSLPADGLLCSIVEVTARLYRQVSKAAKGGEAPSPPSDALMPPPGEGGATSLRAFYAAFVHRVRRAYQPHHVKDGIFGAMMEVSAGGRRRMVRGGVGECRDKHDVAHCVLACMWVVYQPGSLTITPSLPPCLFPLLGVQVHIANSRPVTPFLHSRKQSGTEGNGHRAGNWSNGSDEGKEGQRGTLGAADGGGGLGALVKPVGRHRGMVLRGAALWAVVPSLLLHPSLSKERTHHNPLLPAARVSLSPHFSSLAVQVRNRCRCPSLRHVQLATAASTSPMPT
ncbi:unnamed protein product, partial [Closterium sp. Naga37s-1]